jgi:hypothetical protein
VIEDLPRFVSQQGLWLLNYMARFCWNFTGHDRLARQRDASLSVHSAGVTSSKLGGPTKKRKIIVSDDEGFAFNAISSSVFQLQTILEDFQIQDRYVLQIQ